MKRLVSALAATWALLLVGPVLAGPAGATVLGHSQLVSSSPGASEVLPTPPTELRLVFSEPIEARYTSVDLQDAEGATISGGIGAPDPADRFALVAPTDGLADGAYVIRWQALSAADGHTTSGFFSFGVGHMSEEMMGEMGADGMGDHAARTLANPLEIATRFLNYLGYLVALGLLPIGWFVLRPGYGRVPRRLLVAQGAFLLIGVSGAVGLALVVASRAELALADYLQASRTGQLLVGRLAAGIVGIVAVVVLARIGRTTAGLVAGGIAAAVGLVYLALGGHASAFASPGPLAAMLVHLTAGAIWLAGIFVLGFLALKRDRPPMTTLVPRFSALALLAIAFLAATGFYADWVQTRDVFSVESGYQLTLAIKIALVAAAVALGALNFLDAGNERGWFGGFRFRIGAEVILSLMILVVTGNLGSGFPPAPERPIPIQEAVTSAVIPNAATLELEIGPGRPGPNRMILTVDPAPAEDAEASVELTRLDENLGASTVLLNPVGADGSAKTFVTDGALLPAGSRWDVTAVVKDTEGSETAHSRFVFGLGDAGLVEGKAVPALDPGFLLGLMLLCAGVLGGVYALAGGTLPRVHQATGRIALAGGGVVGSVIGLILVAFGTNL